MEKSLDPTKILTFEFFEDDDDEEVFSFSTVNKYKTDIRNLKMSVMKLQQKENLPHFQSEGTQAKQRRKGAAQEWLAQK